MGKSLENILGYEVSAVTLTREPEHKRNAAIFYLIRTGAANSVTELFQKLGLSILSINTSNYSIPIMDSICKLCVAEFVEIEGVQTSAFHEAIYSSHTYRIHQIFESIMIKEDENLNECGKFTITEIWNMLRSTFGITQDELIALSFGNTHISRPIFDISIELEHRSDVFCIMPFDKKFDAVYNSVRSAAEINKLSCRRADGQGSLKSQDILIDIFTGIKNSQLIICDISGANPNVMYELGIAHAFGWNEVLIISQYGENIPFDISTFRVNDYDHNLISSDFFIEKLEKFSQDITRS